MSRFRKIEPRFWDDPAVRKLPAEEKALALYLITAQSNRVGLFVFSEARAADDLGMSPSAFRDGFRRVLGALQWRFDDVSRVLYIPSWWRCNGPENPKAMIGYLADLGDVPENPFLPDFAANERHLDAGVLEAFRIRMAYVSRDAGKGFRYQETEKETERETETEKEREGDTSRASPGAALPEPETSPPDPGPHSAPASPIGIPLLFDGDPPKGVIPMAQLIARWTEHLDRLGLPHLAKAKIGHLVAALREAWEATGENAEKVLALIDLHFVGADQFTVDKGYRVSLFQSDLAGLIARVNGLKAAPNARSPPNRFEQLMARGLAAQERLDTEQCAPNLISECLRRNRK